MNDGKNSSLFSPAVFRFSAAAAGVAFLLRLFALFSEFQYDEWWTLLRFSPLPVSQILTDLSLPNNHPVNTLILKLLSGFFSDLPLLRGGVFLAGAAVLCLALRLADALWGKWAAAGTLWLMGLSAPLIFYSGTARGYIYQLLGLMLCADALCRICLGGREKRAHFPEIELIAGALLSFLSVSTGILFLAVLGAGFLLLAPAPVRRRPSLWVSAGIIFVAGALYYGVNFSAIREGTRWGMEFPSLFSRFIYFGRTLLLCGFPCFLPWLIPAVGNDRKKGVALLLSFVPLLLLSGSVGGPERVFLPMIPVWALLAASGFARAMEALKRYRMLLGALLVLSSAGLLYPWGPWRPETPAADWQQAMELTGRSGKTMLVLRSSAGYPATLNDPRIAGQWAGMLAGNPDTLCLIGGSPGTINGADAGFAEREIDLPCPPEREDGKFRFFLLSRRNFPEAGKCYLIISVRPEEDARIFAAAGELLTLNVFLASPGKRVYAWKCGETPPNLACGEMHFYLIGERP